VISHHQQNLGSREEQDAALSQGGPRDALYFSVSTSRWHRAVFTENTAFELNNSINQAK